MDTIPEVDIIDRAEMLIGHDAPPDIRSQLRDCLSALPPSYRNQTTPLGANRLASYLASAWRLRAGLGNLGFPDLTPRV